MRFCGGRLHLMAEQAPILLCYGGPASEAGNGLSRLPSRPMLRRDVTMAVSIGDRLARQAATELVGRAKELAILAQLLEPEGPLVYHLHGVGGIGKTSLL